MIVTMVSNATDCHINEVIDFLKQHGCKIKRGMGEDNTTPILHIAEPRGSDNRQIKTSLELVFAKTVKSVSLMRQEL